MEQILILYKLSNALKIKKETNLIVKPKMIYFYVIVLCAWP